MTQKQKADVEDEWFITSDHSMDKEIFSTLLQLSLVTAFGYPVVSRVR